MKRRAPVPTTVRRLRLRAEKRVRQLPARLRGTANPVDAQRLLQELQIHQIELELQNEELRQAKVQVEAGLEKYTDLYDFAPVGYFSLDEQGTILETNLTGAALLGTDRTALVGRRFQLLVAPANRTALRAFLDRVFAGHEKQTCEVMLHPDRITALWADLQALSAVTSSGTRRWCRVALIDITARKRAEEAQLRIDLLAASNRKLEDEIVRRQAVETALHLSEQRAQRLLQQSRALQEELRHISHQIIKVEENQRSSISRRLHDEISQLLLGINVQLAIFTKAAVLHPASVRRAITPLRKLVEESVRVVHQFARDLRPAMLDDLGLIPALRSYIDGLPRRKGQRFEFTAHPGVELLDNDTRTMLYRVAQEGLTNASKHARASRITVSIAKSSQGVSLEVSDNGRAFDVDQMLSAEWGDRLGLIGMRERVEMVGGRFDILSSPGRGTTVRALIPPAGITRQPAVGPAAST